MKKLRGKESDPNLRHQEPACCRYTTTQRIGHRFKL